MSSRPPRAPQRGYSTGSGSSNIHVNPKPTNPPRNLHHLLPKGAAASSRPQLPINSSYQLPPTQAQKRTRVLLSCGPCRTSKQKCMYCSLIHSFLLLYLVLFAFYCEIYLHHGLISNP